MNNLKLFSCDSIDLNSISNNLINNSLEEIIVDIKQFIDIIQYFNQLIIYCPNLKYIYNSQHRVILNVIDMLTYSTMIVDPETCYYPHDYLIYNK